MYYKELNGGRVISCITRKPENEGESIEQMLRRCTANNEPIEATAPMVYTEEADGVQPQFDIRTDRFELALDAVDKYNKSLEAKSKETQREGDPKPQGETKEENG